VILVVVLSVGRHNSCLVDAIVNIFFCISPVVSRLLAFCVPRICFSGCIPVLLSASWHQFVSPVVSGWYDSVKGSTAFSPHPLLQLNMPSRHSDRTQWFFGVCFSGCLWPFVCYCCFLMQDPGTLSGLQHFAGQSVYKGTD
jgi:hypothetical protein